MCVPLQEVLLVGPPSKALGDDPPFTCALLSFALPLPHGPQLHVLAKPPPSTPAGTLQRPAPGTDDGGLQGGPQRRRVPASERSAPVNLATVDWLAPED